MAEIESVIECVCQSLRAGGVEAVIAQYPFGGKKRHRKPIVTVGLKAGAAVSCGCAEYMGLDPVSGNEVYGKRVELTLGLDMWSPKSEEYDQEGCLSLFGQTVGALGSLPEPVKVRELICGETVFDSTAEMFRCGAELKLSACLTAETDSGGQFLDFKLKGVITN